MTDDHPSDALRDLLVRTATSIEPSAGLEQRVADGLARRARRARRRRAAFGVAAMVVVVGLVATIGPEADRAEVTAVDGPSTSGPAVDEPPPVPAIAPSSLAEVADATWQPLPVAPLPAREGAAWASSDRYLVIWGGQPLIAPRSNANDGAVFDVDRGTWTAIAGLDGVAGRRGASAVVVDDTAFVVGGAGDRGEDGPVLAIDLVYGSTRVVGPGPPEPSTYPIVAWSGHEVVVIGGYGSDDERTATVAAFDPATGQWRDGEDLPWPISDGGGFTGADAAAVGRGPVLTTVLPRFTPPVGAMVAPYDLVALRASPTISLEVDTSDTYAVGSGLTVAVPTDDLLVAVGITVPPAAVALDADNAIVWQVVLPEPRCDSPPPSAAALAITYVLVPCGDVVAIDETGATGALPPSGLPEAAVGRLIGLGDSLVLVDLGIPEGYDNGPPQPPLMVALSR